MAFHKIHKHLPYSYYAANITTLPSAFYIRKMILLYNLPQAISIDLTGYISQEMLYLALNWYN